MATAAKDVMLDREVVDACLRMLEVDRLRPNTIIVSPRVYREGARIGLLPGETILFHGPEAERIRAAISARWARKAIRARERYAKRKPTDWWGRPL